MTEIKKTAAKTANKKTNSKKTATKETKTPTMEDILAENFADDPRFEFTIPWNKVQPVYDKVLKSVAKNLRHDGFRPGKVPANIAAEMVEPQYLAQEVLRDLAPAIMQEELKKRDLKVFVEPELVIKEVKPNQDWQLAAYLPQKPNFKLPDYKKILSEEKKKLRDQIKKEQEDTHAQALKVGNPFTPLTEDELKAQATDRALYKLLSEIKPKISPIMVRRSAGRELERMQEQLQKANLTLEDYLKRTGMSAESIEQQLTYSSLQNLQLEFILDALMEAEKITVTEDEILAKIKEAMPNLKTEAEQKQQLQEPQVREYFELIAKRKKLADWLLAL